MNLQSERHWDTLVNTGHMIQGDIEVISQMIAAARLRDNTVYTCGNGGSATTASHFACDLAWGRRGLGRHGVRALSLNDQFALLSALENDLPHDQALAWMIGCYGRPGDVLVAISASGNSRNVLEASVVAKQAGLTVVTLVGFDGGRLKEVADLSVWAPASDFGVVEDLHAMLCHTVARRVAEILDNLDEPSVDRSLNDSRARV